MKKITKTITIKVPVQVIYSYLKESPGKLERYCDDLFGADMIKPSEYSTVSEVPNSKLEFAASKSGTKISLSYNLDKLWDGSSSEITINLEGGWVFGWAARNWMIDAIGLLLALEQGYQVGLKLGSLSSEKYDAEEESDYPEEPQEREKKENEEKILYDPCTLSLCEPPVDDSSCNDSVIDLVATELKADIDSLVELGIELDKGELVTKTGGMAWAGYEAFTGDWLSALVVGGISLLAGTLTGGYKKIKVMEMQQKWKDRLCGMNKEQLMYLAEGLERKYPLLMRRFQSLLEAGQ